MELRDFQVKGAAFLADVERGLLADQMGLGKTAEALAALEVVEAYPAVVVVPATLLWNWADEAARWFPHRRVAVIAGAEFDERADLLVVSYTRLSMRGKAGSTQRRKGALIDELKRLRPQALVLDESHFVKNPDAKRSRACLKLAQGVRYVFLLSGTPATSRPADLANQFALLGRLGELGGRWGFLSRYCGLVQTQWGPKFDGATNTTELLERIEPFYLRRTKEDVLPQLPPKTRTVLPVVLPDEAPGFTLEGYEQAEADFLSWARGQGPEVLRGALAAPALARLGALLGLSSRGKSRAAADWLEALGEDSPDERVVVFGRSVQGLRALRSLLSSEPPLLSGEMSGPDRHELVQQFQAGRHRILLCSIAVGGVGLTLTAASTALFLDLPWTPAEIEQAEDRLHRIGQASPVFSYFLVARGTVDETLADKLLRKAQALEGLGVGASDLWRELVDKR